MKVNKIFRSISLLLAVIISITVFTIPAAAEEYCWPNAVSSKSVTNGINKYKKLLSSAEAELKKLESSSQSAAGYTIFSALYTATELPL